MFFFGYQKNIFQNCIQMKTRTYQKKISAYYDVYYGVLLFFYIYGFHIRAFGFNSVKIVLALVVFEFMHSQKVFIKKSFVYLGLYLSIIVFYSYAKTAYVGYYDVTFPRNTLLILVEDLGLGVLFGSNLIVRGYSTKRIVDIIINVIVAQSVIVILMYFIDPFRNFMFSVQSSAAFSEVSSIESEFYKFRGLGLSYHLFYDLGFLQSFGLVLIMYQYLIAKTLSIISVVKYFIILITVFVIARTGLIGILVSIIIFIFSSVYNHNFLSVYFLKRLVIITCILFMLPFLLPKSAINDFNNKIYPWFFEWYENYKITGRVSTMSSDILTKEMYYELENQLFWYGNGIYKRGSASFEGLTDAGYMRVLIYFGIVGSLLLYGYYVLMMIMSLIYGEKKYKLIPIMFILCLFIVHYKGDVFTGSPLNLRLLHILFIILVIEGSLIVKEKISHQPLESAN